MYLINIKNFGTWYLDISGLVYTIHWSERPLRLTGITLEATIKKWLMFGVPNTGTLVPDLIGEIGGVRVIADFKTSNAPYCATFPDRGDRIGFGGYRKYTKCAQQMAAYRYALNERTGFLCDVALIIVSTPKRRKGYLLMEIN